MEEILEFLMANPWLAIFIIVGVIGNLGGSKAAGKARKQREARRDSASSPPEEVIPPADTGGQSSDVPEADELGRRIRELLEGPAPAQKMPPAPSIARISPASSRHRAAAAALPPARHGRPRTHSKLKLNFG